MRISANNLDREPLGSVVVDDSIRPAQAALRETGQTLDLHWAGALDEQGRVRRCVVCGCREIFKRYDFPQRFGLLLVIGAVVACVILLIRGQVLWAMGVLLGTVVVDRIVYLFTRECLVCYRCRSEFRDVKIDETHESWDLSIGEKYRPVRQANAAADPDRQPDTRGTP